MQARIKIYNSISTAVLLLSLLFFGLILFEAFVTKSTHFDGLIGFLVFVLVVATYVYFSFLAVQLYKPSHYEYNIPKKIRKRFKILSIVILLLDAYTLVNLLINYKRILLPVMIWSKQPTIYFDSTIVSNFLFYLIAVLSLFTASLSASFMTYIRKERIKAYYARKLNSDDVLTNVL